jgi:AbrB family looped-hinge helix DNA binding protein
MVGAPLYKDIIRRCEGWGYPAMLFLLTGVRIMRITSKGQVTIPQELREELGLLPHTEVEFIREGDGVRIVKTKYAKGKTRGDLAIELLRRARPHMIMTTDEVMALTRGDD